MAHFHLAMKVQPRRKDGEKLSAKAHFDYIARQNQYAHMRGRQEDFVLSKSGTSRTGPMTAPVPFGTKPKPIAARADVPTGKSKSGSRKNSR